MDKYPLATGTSPGCAPQKQGEKEQAAKGILQASGSFQAYP